MSHTEFHKAVDLAFEKHAIEKEDDEDKVLQEPGVEGLHVFLDGCCSDLLGEGVDAELISVASIKQVFDDHGWPDEMDFRKEDMEVLLESLGFEKTEEDEPCNDIAEVVEDMRKRKSASQFPLLKTEHLKGKAEKLIAEQCLPLAAKEDHVKIESYIEHQKQNFVESHPVDTSIPLEVQHAQWALKFYYKHVRDYVAMDSLDMKRFSHRFQGSTFIPIIPAHSFADEEKQKAAYETLKLVKPAHISVFDQALWDAWKSNEADMEMLELDKYEAFRNFLEEDYFRILRETCETYTNENTTDPPFHPLVDAAFEAKPEEEERRKDCLSKASLADHEYAVKGTKRKYADYVQGLKPAFKKNGY